MHCASNGFVGPEGLVCSPADAENLSHRSRIGSACGVLSTCANPLCSPTAGVTGVFFDEMGDIVGEELRARFRPLRATIGVTISAEAWSQPILSTADASSLFLLFLLALVAHDVSPSQPTSRGCPIFLFARCVPPPCPGV